jgi:hypothetical protein
LLSLTGNDFSRLFAPLVRDGRMDKFYWKPEREDLLNIVHQMYRDDGLSMADMGVLLDAFPEQPLDFFGALRYVDALCGRGADRIDQVLFQFAKRIDEFLCHNTKGVV